MSSITTIISNSDGKVSLTQMGSKGFRFEGVKESIEKLDVSKCEKIPEFIAMIGNKLNEAIEVINTLKIENEVLKNKIETKVSLQDINNSLSKIKRFEK
ncbi:TPA: hypothetical protein I9Z77_000458 [Clostridium perfringens]|nr:hypothetical protein [Clostridium perfringens]